MATSSQNPLVNTATQAYIYGLPLVLMDLTNEQNLQKANHVNRFSNRSAFCTYQDTSVVRPNCDTFYSSCFFDLSKEPLVMSIPETDDQYYLMPLLDAFTNVIHGSPGKRTGQTGGGKYLLCGANGLPESITLSYLKQNNLTPILCETDLVWALGRFQVDDPTTTDYEVNGGGHVINLQNQLSITNLNNEDVSYDISSTDYPKGPPTLTPNQIVARMSITDYFNRLNQLLVGNPPLPTDSQEMLSEFAAIGVGVVDGVALTFSLDIFDDETKAEMEIIPIACIEKINSRPPSLTDTYWTFNINHEMGHYGTNYYLRAMIAYKGLGANLIEDAVYYGTYDDAQPAKLNGSNKYTLTLNPIPPTKAFWSLTMYNNQGLFIENTVGGVGRYAVGHDSLCPLVTTTNSDGTESAVIYIQSEPIDESDSRYPNWLPAPTPDQENGDFNVMIRVYWPGDAVTDGSWIPPAVELVS